MDENNMMQDSLQQEQRPVDETRVQEFNKILQKYKAGKKKLEQRVISAENWWKLRNADEAIKAGVEKDPQEFSAKSGWLHNVISSKHADAMDNYPEPIILPREPNDAQQAKTLSAVLPVILEQNNFKRTYWHCMWQKLKTGTCVYKVVWDGTKEGGLGDIAISRVDMLHIFWEPGITDIQESRYVFHAELRDNDVLEEEYPELQGKLRGNTINISKFLYDDAVDTTDKSTVVDVYYKKGGALHFCKYVGDTVLVSTENEGVPLYEHGRYPFVFDVLWPVEGSPAGYGFVDLCANPQIYLDLMDTAFLKNTLVGATPRYMEIGSGGINEKEFLDLTKPIVHVDGGSLDDQRIRVIDYRPLGGTYINVYDGKIAELRETSGNTETANGVTGGGVTAASAIAALQEASGKTSRDSTQASYMAFTDIVELVIELIRQFYTLPRQFRITGEMGRPEFATFDNGPMQPTPMYVGNVDMGLRKPVYDVKIKAQKANAYSRTAQNELALQFFGLGFFSPQMATPALACIDMMDFDGKDALVQKLTLNGTLQQQLEQTQQLAMTLLQKYEPELVPQMAGMLGMADMPMQPAGGAAPAPVSGESNITERAREKSAQATEVRP